VFELMPVEGEVARLVASGGTVAELRARAVREGLEPLAAVARRLVLEGHVPVGEYARLL
jgi:general secretion pathway protein E